MVVRRSSYAVAGVAWLTALVIILGAASAADALTISDTVFPLVAIGAGVLMVVAAGLRPGAHLAWICLGLGVVLLGAGEFAWSWYELVLGIEPPFPGPPDVLYLSAYPLLVAGLLLVPRATPNRYQRGQQIIDLVVVVLGLAILAWITILNPTFQDSAGVSIPEALVSSAYPLGDVFLLAIISVLGIRRKLFTRDLATWCAMAAIGAMAVGDFLYVTDLPMGTYESGTWLDAIWLVSYGLFAMSAYWLTVPAEPRQSREGALPLWHALVPVAVVMAINGFHLYDEAVGGDSIMLEAIMTALAFLILGRLLMIVAEDRHLVEEDRRRLISVVSHELRTPLTAVDGYLGLALGDWDGLSDDEKRQMIEIAYDQSVLVTRIVTDLVETTRNNLHATKLESESVDLGDLITHVVGLLELGRRVEVIREPECTAYGDRRRLTQVVTNLISNAERYGAGARIVVGARSVDDEVEISVHDGGAGVPKQYQEQIWEPFERGVHRLDASTPGSGLGLAVVRSLIQAHGGTVGYRDSEVLGGACFFATLPLSVTDRELELAAVV